MRSYDVYIKHVQCLSAFPAVSFDHIFDIVKKKCDKMRWSLNDITIQRRLDGF
jgi:hypothetical protein